MAFWQFCWFFDHIVELYLTRQFIVLFYFACCQYLSSVIIMCDYIMHFYYILKLLAWTDGICFVFFHRQSFQKGFLSPRWFPKSMVNVDSISMPVSSFVKVRDISVVHCRAHRNLFVHKKKKNLFNCLLHSLVGWEII